MSLWRSALGAAIALGVWLVGAAAAAAPARVAPHEAIARLAREALLQALPFDARRVRITALRVPAVRLAGQPASAQAELKANERFRGPTTFALVVVSDTPGAEPARVWATADLRVRMPALVAARDLRRGHALAAGDVVVVERETGGAVDGTLAAAKDAVGQVLKRALPMFGPVRARDLEKAKLIDRGALVTLVVHSGALVVTARGRALQAGARGDTVRAENLGSGKTVFGRVEDSSRVAVEAAW